MLARECGGWARRGAGAGAPIRAGSPGGGCTVLFFGRLPLNTVTGRHPRPVSRAPLEQATDWNGRKADIGGGNYLQPLTARCGQLGHEESKFTIHDPIRIAAATS